MSALGHFTKWRQLRMMSPKSRHLPHAVGNPYRAIRHRKLPSRCYFTSPKKADVCQLGFSISLGDRDIFGMFAQASSSIITSSGIPSSDAHQPGDDNMGRMPANGVAISAPFGSKDELLRVLIDLGVGHAFDAAAIDILYRRLGQIIGSCHQERDRLEAATVAKALLATANHLSEISKILSGLEIGLHDVIEISVAAEIAKYLALDPRVGSLSKAQEIMSAFQQEAARIAHVCMVARAALPDEPGERGRRPIDWYDDFTTLLLEIAGQGGVTPTLQRDRITKLRSGWLLEAAQALEVFLDWEIDGERLSSHLMRSPSVEARGRRLERSLKRLRDTQRQKSPVR